jgi:hypothetical protein
MADPDEEIQFAEAGPEPVLDRMAQRTAAGQGWINLLPAVSDDIEVPQSGGLLSFLAARGPAIPMATWSVGTPTKRGPGRDTIGLQHSSGPRAVARLADLGLGLPAGWIKVMDHSRRGLVVTVPPGQDHEDVLHWLLSAAHALSAVPLTGHWLARVYLGGRG